MKMTIKNKIFICLLFCVNNLIISDELFNIKFSRPNLETSYSLTASLTQIKDDEVFKGNEQVKKNLSYSKITISGKAERKFENKEIKSIDFTVYEFSVKKSPKEKGKALVDKGSLIKIFREGNKVFYTANGKELDIGLIKHLKNFLRLGNGSAIGDDKIFGTDQPQKIGAEWQANKDRIVNDLKNKGIITDEKNIESSVKIVEKIPFGERDVLKIGGFFNCKSFSFQKMPFPSGAKLKSSTLKSSFSGLFPVNVTESPLQSKLEINRNLEVEINSKSGPVILKSKYTKILDEMRSY